MSRPPLLSDLPAARELELAVDVYGLQNVLAALALICVEKSTHIQENWQDAVLARTWERAAVPLDKASEHAAVVEVSR